jgi:pimeloyl-ACP methyl ester carboxylesterase
MALPCMLLVAAPAHAELAFEPCELRGSAGYGRVPAQCAWLEVPEDPARPDGARIRLRVARVASLAADPAADPVILINGGPGASAIDLYVDLAGAFEGVRRHRHIVLMDQRGTGRSARLDCEALQDASDRFDPDAIRRATDACLADLPGDPRFYGTRQAVHDLERLREVLSVPAWNLYGVSYGTRVAQQYARQHPDAIRTLILDGVLPPGIALGPDVALNAEQTLRSLIDRCAESADCADAFPALRAQLESLGQRLRERHIEVALDHPLTGRPESVSLSYMHLAMTLRLLSYAPEGAALIPIIVDEAAARGNFLPIASQALQIEEGLRDAIAFGMHNSVVCGEDVPFYGDIDQQLPALDATYLGGDQVRALRLICERWPATAENASFKAPLVSALPTLLLSGAEDPITPPRYAEQVVAGLANGRHLVAPGQGHGIAARGCVPELIDDFISTGSAAGLDAGCLQRLAPDPFFVDLLGPPP